MFQPLISYSLPELNRVIALTNALLNSKINKLDSKVNELEKQIALLKIEINKIEDKL